MQDIAIHKVRDLSEPVKAAVESLLGRTLQADEEVSVRAFPPHPAPAAEERAAVLRRLEERIDRTAENVKDVSDEELEEVLDEAMKHVRPSYRPCR